MRYKQIPQLLLIAALVLSAFGCAAPQQAATARAQPQLSELAAGTPDQLVRVIAQKMAGVEGVEALVAELGGRVVSNLSIINAFTAEMTAEAALELAKSDGVRWVSLDAAMVSTAEDILTVRDEFNSASYSNNNGTQPWSGAWIEVDGNGTGPASGNVWITDGKLSLDDQPDTYGQPSLARQVDLSGAISATLSFSFETTGGVDTNDSAVVEISADGGANYTVLENFTGISGMLTGNRSYDITSFASNNTRVRFRINNLYGGYYEAFLVDNVQIEYALQTPTSTPSDPPPPTPTASPISQPSSFTCIGPAQDAYMIQDKPTENHGGDNDLKTKPDAGKANRVLIGFDLSSIPSNSPVLSATLRLYEDSKKDGQTIALYRLTDSWVESQVTWNNRSNGASWATPGGDFDASPLATFSPDIDGQYREIDVTGVTQGWVASSYSNYGFLLSATGANGEIKFKSREESNPDKNPVLCITYQELSTNQPLSNNNQVYVTWATSIGTAVDNEYIDTVNMVDATGLGPDEQYGYKAGNAKGSFAGFDAEVKPGYAITKVEAVLYAYVNESFSKDYKIKTYIDGHNMGEAKVNTYIFHGAIGRANAGRVYIDITGTNNWQWIDFYNNLELYIEHAGFASENTVYYDAIGLRVTSAPGTDNSLDALTDTTEPDTYIDPNQQVNVYNQVIGASHLWNTNDKLQGKNIGVAVVDSGIAKVKDLKVKNKVNFNDSYHDSTDRYGHGTFVAGIIAGNGQSSKGKYIGVAPKATLYNVRVSDDNGMTYVSDVIESLQWIYENKDKTKIRVVNLSLNQSVPESYHTSPLDAAVEILWFNGIVVVVSAGNNGTTTLYPPANDPFVITVGAADDNGTVTLNDDMVTTFTAYGITEDGFAKPDLVAPGRNIIGLLPQNDELKMGKDHSNHQIDSTYFKMSGTSVSAPMVSGAIALLLQDEPELNPDQVKARLMATANKNWPGYNPTTAGAGYLDIYAAVYADTTDSANQGITPSYMLATGEEAIAFDSVGWNSVGWNSVGWNSVGWNSVGWNSVGWNSVGWNSVGWNSVGWNSVGWNSDHWDE